MPYLTEDKRFDVFCHRTPQNGGDLNYAFTEISKTYLRAYGESYQHYNDLIGALECCKLELYRRKAAVYEDLKIKENGDTYDTCE